VTFFFNDLQEKKDTILTPQITVKTLLMTAKTLLMTAKTLLMTAKTLLMSVNFCDRTLNMETLNFEISVNTTYDFCE